MPQDTPPNPSGVQPAPSGTQAQPEPVEAQNQTVAYETHRKLLGEKKRGEEERAELVKQNQSLLAEKKATEEKKMLEEKNYTELLKVRETELATERQKRELLEAQQRDQRKAAAFLGAINGQLDVAKYGQLISLEKIALDPQTGEPDPASVTAVAREFETTYPEILHKKTGVTLPSEASRGGNSKITYDEWLRLPVKEMLKRQKEVM